MLARFDCPREMACSSIRLLEAIHVEAGMPRPTIKLDFDWSKLVRMRPPERIEELRGCGYGNREIADMLGYKDARSVNSQRQRYKRELREKGAML